MTPQQQDFLFSALTALALVIAVHAWYWRTFGEALGSYYAQAVAGIAVVLALIVGITFIALRP